MALVTIVLPTRGRTGLLARALRSACAQTHREVEVVVVDDNADKTALENDPMLRAAFRDSRVVVLPPPPLRPFPTAAAARNRGLEAARGEWITFLDDDDECLPEKVARQLARAVRTGAPVALCGFEARLAGRRRVRQAAAEWFADDALLTGAVWGTPFIFHRRCMVRFDPALAAGEDRDYGLALCRHFDLRRVPNVPAPLYRVHGGAPARVNQRAADLGRADRVVLRRYGAGFSPAARRLFASRSRLASLKHAGGPIRRWGRVAAELLARGGVGEGRALVNALLFRLPPLRRWLLA